MLHFFVTPILDFLWFVYIFLSDCFFIPFHFGCVFKCVCLVFSTLLFNNCVQHLVWLPYVNVLHTVMQ